MKIVTCIALIAAMVLLVPNVLSQNSERVPGVPQFNIQQEVRLTGEIREIKNYSCPITGTVGTHLELQTTEGPIEAHVAAARFLQQYGIEFHAGQTVDMIGVKRMYEGRAAFLPRIIMVGNGSYYMRDNTGKPLW
ncbi:MAG TPA: hypothetical protein VEI52_19620 [Terriglobales bacterium]|nr:hypothetical protein [Terriglobales bacterium]